MNYHEVTDGLMVCLNSVYRVYRLSMTLQKVLGPSKRVINSHNHHYFRLFPKEFRGFRGFRKRGKMRKGRERRRRDRGGGEGYWLLDILDGQWATNLRSGSEVSLDGHLCS